MENVKRTSLRDIAERLGLSQNSISVALRGGAGINADTRELILKTAREMGYMPRKRKSVEGENVLLISTSSTAVDPYFFNHLFTVIQNEIIRMDYSLLSIDTVSLKASFSAEGSFRQYLSQNHIVGIFVLGDIDAQTCAVFHSVDTPIVGVSFYLPGIPMSCVLEDNLSGSYLLVQHLVERGYRKMGFIGNLENTSFWERYSAAKGAQIRFGLSDNSRFDLLNLDSNDASAVECLEYLLSNMPELPEAFICCNDHMAAVTLKALRSRGLHCPDDIAVVGFDNNEIGRLSMPTITSVDTFRNLQGSVSVQLLNELISSKKGQNYRIVLPVRFQEGCSVKQLDGSGLSGSI